MAGLYAPLPWLAYTLPYRRFADVLADACARIGGDVGCYSFIAVDFHHILLASLPAHSLTLRPAHAHGHQVATAIQRLQTFRHLHACSGCFRLERMPGGTCTHWKAPPCTAHGTSNRHACCCCGSSSTAEARRASGAISTTMARNCPALLAPFIPPIGPCGIPT